MSYHYPPSSSSFHNRQAPRGRNHAEDNYVHPIRQNNLIAPSTSTSNYHHAELVAVPAPVHLEGGYGYDYSPVHIPNPYSDMRSTRGGGQMVTVTVPPAVATVDQVLANAKATFVRQLPPAAFKLRDNSILTKETIAARNAIHKELEKVTMLLQGLIDSHKLSYKAIRQAIKARSERERGAAQDSASMAKKALYDAASRLTSIAEGMNDSNIALWESAFKPPEWKVKASKVAKYHVGSIVGALGAGASPTIVGAVSLRNLDGEIRRFSMVAAVATLIGGILGFVSQYHGSKHLNGYNKLEKTKNEVARVHQSIGFVLQALNNISEAWTDLAMHVGRNTQLDFQSLGAIGDALAVHIQALEALTPEIRLYFPA